MSFKSWVSLLIFCLDDLSLGINGVLKSHTTILSMLVSPFMVFSICLLYRGATMLGRHRFTVFYIILE